MTKMETDQYNTLAGITEGLYKEKGSKFLAFAIPVESVDDIKNQLDHYRKKFHDARHHCYAWQLGEEPFEFRYNDDGEPSNTAGKPIYGQIQSFSLTNILIIVVRYFGGVKLGTGGLIQAYRNAARDAISKGEIVQKTWTAQVRAQFNFHQMNDVMRIIKEETARVIRMESDEKTAILLEISKGKLFELEQRLKTLEKVEITVI